MTTSAAPHPERTQPNCRVFDDLHPTGSVVLVTCVTANNGLPRSIEQLILLQHGYCTFVIILFRPFASLFINLAMSIRALFSKSATTLGLVEQAFWRVPFLTEWSGASSFEVILARQSSHSPLGLLPLGLGVLDAFRSLCCMKEFGDGFDGELFPRLLIS